MTARHDDPPELDFRQLTVRQPHADSIVSGRKTIEVRSRPTTFRGWVAVAASSVMTVEDRKLWESQRAFRHCGFLAERWSGPPVLGAIIGAVRLTGCHPVSGWCCCARQGAGPHRDGTWHWELESPARFSRPVPTKGTLGLTDAPLTLDQRTEVLNRRVDARVELAAQITRTEVHTFLDPHTLATVWAESWDPDGLRARPACDATVDDLDPDLARGLAGWLDKFQGHADSDSARPDRDGFFGEWWAVVLSGIDPGQDAVDQAWTNHPLPGHPGGPAILTTKEKENS
jgi:hypothetical protein